MIKNGKVQAYSPIQMWFHKHMMHFVIFLIISGLPILSQKFSFIAYLAGVPVSWFTGVTESGEILAAGVQFLRLVHWVNAFLLTLIALPFTLVMLKNITGWNLWPDRWGVGAMVDGMVQMKNCYISLDKAKFGKFNIGQKASAWLIIGTMIALMGSGYALILRDFISPEMAVLARGVHAVCFVLLALTLILHVYFSTHPINRAAFKAMFRTGEMEEGHVKEHHGYWYEKIKNKTRK